MGLLLLRFGLAVPLTYLCAEGIAVSSQSLALPLRFIAVVGGILIFFGLWTPLAGIVVAIDELWSVFAIEFIPPDNQWLHVVLAILAASVAMIGPGAWSVDARLFGRKRFEVNGRHHRQDPH